MRNYAKLKKSYTCASCEPPKLKFEYRTLNDCHMFFKYFLFGKKTVTYVHVVSFLLTSSIAWTVMATKRFLASGSPFHLSSARFVMRKREAKTVFGSDLNQIQEVDQLHLRFDGRNPAPVWYGTYLIIYTVFIHPRWFAGILPSTVPFLNCTTPDTENTNGKSVGTNKLLLQESNGSKEPSNSKSTLWKN